jgi:hypothetical protein
MAVLCDTECATERACCFALPVDEPANALLIMTSRATIVTTSVAISMFRNMFPRLDTLLERVPTGSDHFLLYHATLAPDWPGQTADLLRSVSVIAALFT